MGLFDAIFKRPQALKQWNTYQTLTGYQPVWTSWNGCLYESDLVRTAIDARARHASKLQIEVLGGAKPKLATRLKHAPNDFQTWGQFLYRLSTILDLRNTAFIVPTLGEFGEPIGVYPIVPQSWELVSTADNTPYLRFTFDNGNCASMELAKVGIMTKFQYKSDFFGESNVALDPTMALIDIQNQGIKEGIKNSATFRFMATLANYSNDDDLKKERDNFSKTNLQSGGGLLLFPHTYKDIQQIDSKPFVISSAQMNTIQSNVFNYFGVNEDVLQNKAYGDAWSAFYEGAIEPFAVQLSEVLTKMLYTEKEQSNGAKLMATANRLQYMSNSEKLAVSTQLTDRGLLTLNEAREIWNLPRIESEDGDKFIIRGEYYNANDKLNEPTEGANNAN